MTERALQFFAPLVPLARLSLVDRRARRRPERGARTGHRRRGRVAIVAGRGAEKEEAAQGCYEGRTGRREGLDVPPGRRVYPKGARSGCGGAPAPPFFRPTDKCSCHGLGTRSLQSTGTCTTIRGHGGKVRTAPVMTLASSSADSSCSSRGRNSPRWSPGWRTLSELRSRSPSLSLSLSIVVREVISCPQAALGPRWPLSRERPGERKRTIRTRRGIARGGCAGSRGSIATVTTCL